MDQQRATSDLALSVDAYIARCRRKTGALFSVACRLGAVLSGAGDEAQARLAAFGEHVGVAFQIFDDILDIACEQSGKSGKPALVAVEAAGIVAMEMLEQDGVLTIGAVSMPGSSPAVRLMMYPDGHKLGVERIAASLENGITRLVQVLDKPDEARAQLLGS